MANAKLILIFLPCLVFLVVAVVASNQEPDSVSKLITSQEGVLETLEYIAQGYETCTRQTGQLNIQGRIFYVQQAQKGHEVPENKIFAPQWLNFEYTEKAGKRRYEQDRLSVPDKRYYALDNNKQLLTFTTNIVSVYPLRDEESRWSHLMQNYGDFLRLSNNSGYENVGRAMSSLIEEIRSGRFDQEDWSISIGLGDQSLFTIYIKRGIVEEEYAIDSQKGFNLIRARYFEPLEKFWRDYNRRCEYAQLDSGQWIVTKAESKGVENGVAYEKRLETSDIKVDFEAPDEIFEKESLNIPIGTYLVDYSFSPPIELKNGATLDVAHLDELVESQIEKTEVAQVNDKGRVTIGTHRAFVEHANADGRIVAASETKQYRFVMVFTIVLTLGGIVLVLVYLRLRRMI